MNNLFVNFIAWSLARCVPCSIFRSVEERPLFIFIYIKSRIKGNSTVKTANINFYFAQKPNVKLNRVLASLPRQKAPTLQNFHLIFKVGEKPVL